MSGPFFRCAWQHRGHLGYFYQCTRRAGHWRRCLGVRGDRWRGGF